MTPQTDEPRIERTQARYSAPRARRALHIAWISLAWSLVVLFFLFSTLLLVMRYAVMPHVDEFRPRVEQLASRALRAPVAVGRIEASWHGFNPHFVLTEVSITGRDGARALSLPRVEGTLSWLSALALEPRFSLLRIEAPDVEVARLPGDRFSIAGFVLDPNNKGEDAGASDWILAQGEVVIQDARVRYVDQRPSAAASFELTQVNVQLENVFGSHLMGLQGQPTAAIAGPLDLRARFRHSPFARVSDYKRWSGEVFGQIDYADLAALARIFGAPLKLERADGAVRTWVTFDRARLTRVIADVALTNLNVTLADDLQPLTLASLQGRVSQRSWGADDGSGGSGQEFEANRLLLVTAEKLALPPLDIKVRTTHAKAAATARTQVQASRIDLENLAWFATHIPLARDLRQKVAKLALEGMLTDVAASWDGSATELINLKLKAHFEHLVSAAQPHERQSEREVGQPGFENLSGSIDVSEGAGTLQLASKDAVVIFPGVFAEPRIKLTRLNASVSWKSNPALEVRVASLAAANADIDVDAAGTYRAASDGSSQQRLGWLDMNGRVTRLQAPAAFRYMPLIAGNTAIEWVQHALLSGKVTDGAFRVKGHLAHFPFDGERTGEMRITARVGDATLDVYPALHPAPSERASDSIRSWPLLTAVDADLLFDRASMTVTARGTAQGAQLSSVVAHIADFRRNPTLDVRGAAEGALMDMLRYANASPVAGWTGGVTKAEATGPAKLDLRFSVPLQHARDTKVAGALHFANNDLQLTDVPAFSKATGTLNFTESSVSSTNLNATTLGGPAKIEVSTRTDQSIVFVATGTATVPALRRAVAIGPVQQLLDRSSGQARYTATVTVKPIAELKIESDLVGIAIDGIAPLRKTAQEAMPLRVERNISSIGNVSSGDRDELRISAGRVLAVRLERRLERNEYRVTRGVIALNEPANLPESGLLVLANVPRLDLEAWAALFGASAKEGSAKPPAGAAPQMQIDLLAVRTQELIAMGRSFRNVTLGASHTADGGFGANIVSDGVAGHIAWRPEQVTARLSRLSIPAAGKSEVIETLRAPPQNLPALDIVAEQFELADIKFGRLDMLAQNVGVAAAPTWRVRRFDITNADMKLTASGDWTPAANAEARRMKINFKLDARDAGATLDRLGFAGAMASGSGLLEGDVEWRGSPLDIDYPTLTGKLALNLDNGRFLKVNTGNAARLLSLLSLQSLSRTMFDGGRQFAGGFAFNSIRADATVAQGVISTNNFRMAGASAAALMSGTIDLRNETQQLHLIVLPEIDASTAALALGVANPVLGLGAFLATYLFRDPLSKALALEYDISGTWTQPNVARRGRDAANAAASAEPNR